MTVINFIASFIKHTDHKINFYIVYLFEDIATLQTSFKPFLFFNLIYKTRLVSGKKQTSWHLFSQSHEAKTQMSQQLCKIQMQEELPMI